MMFQKYRLRCSHEGEIYYSGTRSYCSAKALVDSGQALAVVLDEEDFPQVYPSVEKRERHASAN